MPPRFIETDHLLLRPFAQSDAPQFFHALFGDPDVTEWLPTATLESVDDARAMIRKMQLGWERNACFAWALEDKRTGFISAMIEIRPNLPRVELGVAISMRETHQRRRAGLAALRKLIDWIIAQPGVQRLYACCSPQSKSAPVMEKLGFKFEGRLVNWDARPNAGLEIDDALMFAMTKPMQAQPEATCALHEVQPIASQPRARETVGAVLTAY
ncbi:GNAT family N-acetyltransferase [Trinickia acidisoli]|uniref:GNAT family N-acetyltransferase n=1 Tax=Trinickia acidisoli TaxID=2767482 RepID=UPI001A8D2B24|nr:GNAT family N-acetyltransferase [Trinickia acidisoli]